MRHYKASYLVVLFVIITALSIIGLLKFRRGNILPTRYSSGDDVKPASALFVGDKVCADCHEAEYELWQSSDHDHAMQKANEKTVLGDFNGAEFTYFDVTSKFYKKDGKYKVLTDGPDGELKEYEIKYTFGFYPLQQYLIEFPDGWLQALGIAWDSRPREDGGQRWFHLYPDENITYKDTIHWTGIDQNWNHMCAECHSTDLEKNYDLATDSYKTTWSEINVSCEACHGPGSEHVKWAEQKYSDDFQNMGLLVSFDERKGVSWTINEESGNAVRNKPLESHTEIETCARCHSRRSAISDNYVHGWGLLDTHIPALLDEGVYYPDGQILDEDYEWGSFVQSGMYHKGVTCTDCHDPHSLKLREEGNMLCSSCHSAEKYDTASHHHHKQSSAGSNCVSCHMPETNYMVIDARRDHSIRIPRPDLSDKIGTPNACNNCHTDRTPEWAVSEINGWGGGKYIGYQNYGETLYAARTGAVHAEELLVKLVDDENAPSIARATALTELGVYLSPSSLGAVEKGLSNDDPLIRGAAIDALQAAPHYIKLRLAFNLLHDPVLAVRMKAVTLLAGVPRENLTEGRVKTLDEAVNGYVKSQMTNADRPEAHMNIGLIYAQLGWFSEAETQYNTAMKLQPSFVPAYVNLADLYRMEGRDTEGERLLRSALEISPRNGDLYHALGLLLVRQKRIPEAMNAFEESVKLSPDNTRYSYVYAVALNDTGDKSGSIRVLEEAHKHRPADRDVLYGLITFNSENGDILAATEYAEKLLELSPDNPDVAHLLNELKRRDNR